LLSAEPCRDPPHQSEFKMNGKSATVAGRAPSGVSTATCSPGLQWPRSSIAIPTPQLKPGELAAEVTDPISIPSL
jgi:hypothetical protein